MRGGRKGMRNVAGEGDATSPGVSSRRPRHLDIEIKRQGRARSFGAARPRREGNPAGACFRQRNGDRACTVLAEQRTRHIAGVAGAFGACRRRRQCEREGAGRDCDRVIVARHSQYSAPAKEKQCLPDALGLAEATGADAIARGGDLAMQTPLRVITSPRPHALATHRPPTSASCAEHSGGHRPSRRFFISSSSAASGAVGAVARFA